MANDGQRESLRRRPRRIVTAVSRRHRWDVSRHARKAPHDETETRFSSRGGCALAASTAAAAEGAPRELAQRGQLRAQGLRALQLCSRARLVMRARARIAAFVPAEVTLAQSVGTDARGELDGDHERAVRDRA